MPIVDGDGVIRRCYDVHCAGCATWHVPNGRTKHAAEKDLRRSGWRTLGGLWHCPGCVEERNA